MTKAFFKGKFVFKSMKNYSKKLSKCKKKSKSIYKVSEQENK